MGAAELMTWSQLKEELRVVDDRPPELLPRTVLQVDEAPVDLLQDRQRGGNEELRLDVGKMQE